MNPNVRPSLGDRVRMGAEAVRDAVVAPFRAIRNFADRVGDALGVGGRVRDRVNVIEDNVGGVGDRIRHGAQNLPVVGGMVERVSPVREEQMLEAKYFKAVRPAVVREVAEDNVRGEMALNVADTAVQQWQADATNANTLNAINAEALRRNPDAQDPANQPQVDQARAEFIKLNIARQIVAGRPVSEAQINAHMAEANRIVPLTNEQYYKMVDQLASPHISPQERDRWVNALGKLRERAAEHALHEYHDHHIRADLRKDGKALAEVDSRCRNLLNGIDFAGAISDPNRDVKLREIKGEVEADPVVKAVVKNKENLTHPITEHKVGNLENSANREELRRGVAYDVLGYGALCFDASGNRVMDVSTATNLINSELTAARSVHDLLTKTTINKPILDRGPSVPVFSKEALIDKLKDHRTSENLVLIMELWAMRDASGNFRTSMDSNAYIQKLSELKGKDFNAVLLDLGYTQSDIDIIKGHSPELFTAGDQHFGQEVAVVNKPYFDLLAVDTADAYGLYVDSYMLDELTDVLIIRNGKIVVDPTKVTPLNARVYNIVAHDLMNNRDVLNALVEQIIAQNPGQYNDISVLPDSYFLTERQAVKELPRTLEELEKVKDQQALEICLKNGLSPEEAMRVINKKERNVLKDFFKGSFNGVGRVLRGVAVIMALGAIGGTAGNIIAVGMGLYAAWNLLRGGFAMAGEGIDWTKALIGHQIAKFKGDKEGADRFAEEIKERTRRLLGLAIGTATGAAASFVFGPAAAGVIPLIAIPAGKAAEAMTTVREKGEIKKILDTISGDDLPAEERAAYVERLRQLASGNNQAFISSITTGLIFGSSAMATGMRLTGTDSLISRWSKGKDALVEGQKVDKDGVGDGKIIDKDVAVSTETETIDISMADRVLPIGVERGLRGGHEAIRFVNVDGADALEYAPGSSVAQGLERILSGDMTAKAYDAHGIGVSLVRMFVSSDEAFWTQQLGQDGVRMLIDANEDMTLKEIIAQANKNPGGIWFPTKAFNNMMPTVNQPK